MLVQSTGDERSGQKKPISPLELSHLLSQLDALSVFTNLVARLSVQAVAARLAVDLRQTRLTDTAPPSLLSTVLPGALRALFVARLRPNWAASRLRLHRAFREPVAPTATKTSRASQTSSLMPFSRRRHQRTITGLGSFTTLITRTSGFIETTLKTRIFFEAFDCEPFET